MGKNIGRGFYLESLSCLGILLMLVSGSSLHAAPRRMSRLLPSGIVYPEFTEASRTNSATLAYEKTRGVQMKLGSGFQDTDPLTTSFSFAAAEEKVGVGGGLTHRNYSENDQYELFAGVGLRVGDVNMGIMYSQEVSDSNPALVSMSLNYAPIKGINVSGIFHDVGHLDRRQFELGAGYAIKSFFNVEANILTPRRNTNEGSIVSLAGTYYWNYYGAAYKLTMNTFNDTFKHTLSGAIWLTAVWNASIQYTTPQTFLLGTTVIF